jgi:hypothetical protein
MGQATVPSQPPQGCGSLMACSMPGLLGPSSHLLEQLGAYYPVVINQSLEELEP